MNTVQHIGRYHLQQRVSQDGASEVWRAYDTSAQRPVILKVYHTALPGDAVSLAFYMHHVEQVTALHHPNIVPIYAMQVFPSGSADSDLSLICIAMEDAGESTLADYIKSSSAGGKIPVPTDLVSLFASIAQALDYAHQHGIIHGNLKPTNILLQRGMRRTHTSGSIGTPLLTDFALTKPLLEKHSSSMPSYLAPEQITHAAPDERSDIYALGVLLYELTTGMLPFRGSRPIAVMMQHVNAQPTPPDLVNPGISPALTQVILRCLAKNPDERFSHAASLAVALAQALHTPVPTDRRFFTVRSEERHGFTSPPSTPIASSTSGTAHGTNSGTVRKAVSEQPLSESSRAIHHAHASTSRQKRGRFSPVLLALIALTFLLSTVVGTLVLVQRESAPTIQGTGQVLFLNSSQITENSAPELNDELQIDLSNMPDPAAGKSYYAWLLGDMTQTEASPLFLGRVTVEHGTIHVLYTDPHHTNLLGLASRFLITEDDARHPSSDPFLNQQNWRYYAAIPQTPNPTDALHFSLLDHVRHLLVESPELAVRGLHGGLAFWFVKESATISDAASGLSDDWHRQDATAIHTQIIRVLDILDGASFVTADVPPGTPLLADARMAQVGLLGPAPQTADPPGYIYQNEAPPGYVYLIQMHLNGAVLAPQTTPAQHQIAIRINGGIDTIKRLLTQVYQDARQLVRLSQTQLLQPSTLPLLNDLATQARSAYSGTGQPHASGSATPGSAVWTYTNLQQLATFHVFPYTGTPS